MKSKKHEKLKEVLIITGITLLIFIGISIKLYFVDLKYPFKVNMLHPCKYERTVDGDTIVVNINNREEKIRLIGVDAPESVHPDVSKNTAAGKKVSEFTNSFFTAGQTLYLEYDNVNKDKYGRTLAYVWLSNKIHTKYVKEFVNDFCDNNYNAILLRKTTTIRKDDLHNRKYEGLFHAISLIKDKNK